MSAQIDILTDPGDLEAVRIVLGVTTRDVSDDILKSLVGIPAAELLVKDRFTTWAAILTAADADTDRLKLGTIYYTAALLLPRLTNLLRAAEKVGEFTLGQISWEKLREHLLELAGTILGDIGTNADDEVSVFSVYGPSRKYRELKAIGLAHQAEFQNV